MICQTYAQTRKEYVGVGGSTSTLWTMTIEVICPYSCSLPPTHTQTLCLSHSMAFTLESHSDTNIVF